MYKCSKRTSIWTGSWIKYWSLNPGFIKIVIFWRDDRILLIFYANFCCIASRKALNDQAILSWFWCCHFKRLKISKFHSLKEIQVFKYGPKTRWLVRADIFGCVHCCEVVVWTGAVFLGGDRCLLPPLLSLSAGFTWIGRFIWKDRGSHGTVSLITWRKKRKIDESVATSVLWIAKRWRPYVSTQCGNAIKAVIWL